MYSLRFKSLRKWLEFRRNQCESRRCIKCNLVCVFAFPNRLGKAVEGEPVDSLFGTFMAWRAQLVKGLNVSITSNVEASAYFKKEREVRLSQKRSLLKKSIIWSLFEMNRYSRNPKSEWLGAYR